MEKFSVGTTLGTALRVWLRNLVPFALITAALRVPTFVWLIWFNESEHTATERTWFVYEKIGAGIVLNSFVAATITYGVVKELQGLRAPIFRCISTGFSRMLPALAVGALASLAFALGLLLLILPGIAWYCMLYVATPASVIERPGVIGALRRSRALTNGRKPEIFALVLTVIAVLVGAQWVQHMLFPRDYANYHMNLGINFGIDIAIGSFMAVLAAVAYCHLRAEKEGTTATELAKVFE